MRLHFLVKNELSPGTYAAMMRDVHTAVAKAHASGADVNDVLRGWQASNMRLSKAEIRIILNRLNPRQCRKPKAA